MKIYIFETTFRTLHHIYVHGPFFFEHWMCLQNLCANAATEDSIQLYMSIKTRIERNEAVP